MYAPVVACLRCPLCHGGLAETEAGSGRALRCVQGHSFDIAKQGYANLCCPPPAYAGDTPAMVASRAAFLEAGHYHFIAAAISAAARERCANGLVVEAGAGTGYYLGAVLDALPESSGLALDISKAALRRAARAHPRAGAALCDIWRSLPVADASATLLLSVFSPRNGAEFERVLARDGALVVVAPTAEHMRELIGPLGLLSIGHDKDEAVAASLGAHFERVEEQRHDALLQLTHDEVQALVLMGPSAWHVDAAQLTAAIAQLPEPVAVTASVTVSVFRLV